MTQRHVNPIAIFNRSIAPLLLALSFLLPSTGCESTPPPHLLVMGGGSKPTSNQVSLEKNINYFYRVLDHLSLEDANRKVLFACGNDPAEKDLQYLDPASDDPQVMRLIDMLIGPGKGNIKKYRPHDVGGGEIASSKDHIVQWFTKHAITLKEKDSLLVYFTGHGGKGEKDNAQNTSLYLWPKHNMRMKPFAQELDKLSPQTPVVLVMVQCYAGGFANVIFKEGDPAKGLSEHNRCGFYAAVHNRTASGCTPHVNEADYKEYSSYFWAALAGEDRLGEPVERPDYDGNGKTSYLEAHAYAIIHSDSADLSITTSDRLVRAIKIDTDSATGTLEQDSPYSKLHAAADTIRKAMLDGLSDRLDLTGEDRYQQAQKYLEEIKTDQRDLQIQRGKSFANMSKLRKELLGKLTERWPELKDIKKPEALATLVEHAQPIREAIADEAAFAKLNEAVDAYNVIKEEREALTTKKAHTERFIYTCETVAKTDAFIRLGKPEHVAAYHTLHAREMATPAR